MEPVMKEPGEDYWMKNLRSSQDKIEINTSDKKGVLKKSLKEVLE